MLTYFLHLKQLLHLGDEPVDPPLEGFANFATGSFGVEFTTLRLNCESMSDTHPFSLLLTFSLSSGNFAECKSN